MSDSDVLPFGEQREDGIRKTYPWIEEQVRTAGKELLEEAGATG